MLDFKPQSEFLPGSHVGTSSGSQNTPGLQAGQSLTLPRASYVAAQLPNGQQVICAVVAVRDDQGDDWLDVPAAG
jgi:hypothetical protein